MKRRGFIQRLLGGVAVAVGLPKAVEGEEVAVIAPEPQETFEWSEIENADSWECMTCEGTGQMTVTARWTPAADGRLEAVQTWTAPCPDCQPCPRCGGDGEITYDVGYPGGAVYHESGYLPEPTTPQYVTKPCPRCRPVCMTCEGRREVKVTARWTPTDEGLGEVKQEWVAPCPTCREPEITATNPTGKDAYLDVSLTTHQGAPHD